MHRPQSLETTEEQASFFSAAEKPARKSNARDCKQFVLDTNVLLHDPHCLNRFENNHVFLPVEVLSELDRFKNEPSERGANARTVHRFLTQIFGHDPRNVTRGVATCGGGTLRLLISEGPGKADSSPALRRFRRIFPDQERMDHRILAAAIALEGRGKAPTILVTKDLNMQLKALSVGLRCEDYLNDKVAVRDAEGFEIRQIPVDAHELQRFGSSREIELPLARRGPVELNEYVVLVADEEKQLPARHMGDGVFYRLRVPPVLPMPKGIELRPANLGQQCFLDALLDPTISLITCYGQAGTGKTLLAVAAGLYLTSEHHYNGLTVSRPVVAMGDTLGFLPGTLQEKMQPWLQSIYDAFDVLLPLHPRKPEARGRNASDRKKSPVMETPAAHGATVIRKPYEKWIEQGLLEIEALCYIRGRSIPNRYFVLDEAQQLTPLEAKTVVTRMSRGSKLVMVGDPAQIDNPYVDSRSNGLVYARNRLRGQAVTSHISLTKGERSPLAELGATLM
jgi:PhoH-like ATPase